MEYTYPSYGDVIMSHMSNQAWGIRGDKGFPERPGRATLPCQVSPVQRL